MIVGSFLAQAINKYKTMSKPARASMWFIISNVVLRGISFITLPIFSRILTTEEYGIVSVYHSWVSIFTIITTLTIWGGVFNVGMVKYENRQSELVSSFQGLATFITVCFFALTIILHNYSTKYLKLPISMIICIYVEILAVIPFNLWATRERYLYNYKKLIAITAITAILNPLLGYFAVIYSKDKAFARVASGVLIQLIIGIIFFVSNYIKGKKLFSMDLWKFGFMFNIVLVPHYLSSQVLNQSDRIMINNLCGASDAGIYSVAYNFAMLLSLVTNGINSSLTPHIYQSLKEKRTDQLSKETTSIILIVSIITILAICLVPDVFKLMLPQSYYDAIWVIPPVTVGAFFLFLYPLFGSVEFFFEEKIYVTLASIIGAILNILLNYVFIKIFGFIAAAYTTLFCYMCFSLCHYLFMKKVLKKNGIDCEIYDAKKIIFISIILIIVMIMMLFLYSSFFARWIVIAIVCTCLIYKGKQLKSLIINMLKKN